MLASLEEVQFAVDLGVASSFRTILQTLRSDGRVQRLVELLGREPASGVTVLRRLADLVRVPVTPGHGSPHDAAVTAMLAALCLGAPVLQDLAITEVLAS